MTKVGLPPKKENTTRAINHNVDEKKIQEVINRGGSTGKISIDTKDYTIKTISIKLTAETLDIIGQLCDKRQKRPGRKLAMAKYDWIVEAVNEKLEREQKEYIL